MRHVLPSVFGNTAQWQKWPDSIKLHFDDLTIEHSPRDPLYLSLFRLLVSVATQGKADNIPPNLGGELLRSILAGLPYPQTLARGLPCAEFVPSTK